MTTRDENAALGWINGKGTVLSTRAINRLQDLDIFTPDQLREAVLAGTVTARDILRLRNGGRKTVREIAAFLAEDGGPAMQERCPHCGSLFPVSGAQSASSK